MRSLAALRELARKRDADFEKRVLSAEMNLRSIQYQRAMAELSRAVDFRETTAAPNLCVCVDSPVKATR